MIDNQEKLQNLEKTAVGYAHEIKNPITAVRGLLQLLANPDLPAPKRSLYSEVAIEELDRANYLLNEMVYDNPLSYQSSATIDIKDAVHKAMLLFDQTIQVKHIKVQANFMSYFKPLLPKIQLSQVLANLLKNAVEACSENGTITISVFKEDNFGIISIKDNGCGISAEALEQLFTPFYTTKKDGTGIGLSICKSIIEEVQGSITVHSILGEGTEFIVKLPLKYK
ncbi:GHKL domain-containing protein [Niallia circulans]|uniref:histidine kinase n=1 Tax=Niallia circulans TaxID=1397 RepID=A0A553SMX2_NIACI|nr:ATP-binding protein [Niallia circulans]TRZ38341.1 GHKL domain-containing protein [Niallia circulans]